jgi:hypothetical protein
MTKRVNDQALIFVVGLTGVGKSSSLEGIQTQRNITILPNRRQLTDRIIIPEVQRWDGSPTAPVTDRLERFEYTRRYREHHSGGVVHALEGYLEATPVAFDTPVLFDNIRGADETRHAVNTFGNSRFIVLDAPPLERLKRMATRKDSFDQVRATRLENDTFIANLQTVPDADKVFDLYEVARLEAAGYDEDALLTGVRIISREQVHYDAQAAFNVLEHLPDKRLLYVDTSMRPLEDVVSLLAAWL